MAALKSQFQLATEKGMSQAMFDIDLKVWQGPERPATCRLRLTGLLSARWCRCLRCELPVPAISAVAATCKLNGTLALAVVLSFPPTCRNSSQPHLVHSPHLMPQGKDWNGQLKYGTSNFYGANYFQSVTPQLSLGGEVFYLAEQRRRCVGRQLLLLLLLLLLLRVSMSCTSAAAGDGASCD